MLSRMIARDVRRDLIIVSAERLAEGFVTVRVRTNNLLYLHQNLTDEEEFGAEVELPLSDLWAWSGESWGGLSDGTSITGISPSDN